MKTFWKILVTLSIAAALGSCRNPPVSDDWTPDAGDFDAAPDDAGPGELCPASTPDLFNNAHSPYIGGEQSVELEVVNFSFFRCPHCANFAEWTRDEWETNAEYRDRVRLFFHHFPFSADVNWEVHAATVAATNQGMDNFWAMHDLLFAGMNEDEPYVYNPGELRDFAKDVLGLDMDQYDADVTSTVTYGFLQWDRAQLEALGYTSTPSIYVCGERLGAWTSLDGVLDAYLGN